MDNEQLYKLAFELAVGDISKCPEDSIYYNPNNGEEVRIKAELQCKYNSEAYDCDDCRQEHYLKNAKYMLEK